MSTLPSWLFERRLDFLQLGPGSANIGAALLACLLVSGTIWFFYRPWWAQAIGWIWILIGGFLLLATRSRGGVLAAIAGLVWVWWCWKRRLLHQDRSDKIQNFSLANARGSKQKYFRWILAACVLSVLVIYSFSNRTLYRFGLGDSSRADLWSAGLAMLWDAPGGWGKGNAANAYVQWYQAEEDPRGYLSLINYHLNWLVEHGMTARIGYILAWATLFWLLCGASTPSFQRNKENRSKLVQVGVLETAAGVWTTFFVAAIFSSTARWGPLWTLPALWLVVALMYRWGYRSLPSWRGWVSATSIGLLALAGLHLAGWMMRREPLSLAGKTRIIIGTGTPRVVFYQPEPMILGERWGQDIRRLIKESSITADIILEGPASVVDPKAAIWVVTAILPEIPAEPGEVVFFNTVCLPEVIAWIAKMNPTRIRVYISDSLNRATRLDEWESIARKREDMQVEIVGGAGVYLPGWPDFINGENIRKHTQSMPQ